MQKTERQPGLTRRKIIIQVAGFAVGLFLLYLCIRTAVVKSDGNWRAILDADPLLIFALVGFGLLSTVIDGFVFWAVLRPSRRLRLLHVESVNMSVALANYAPVRLGTILRVAYHARVDGVELVTIVAWFVSIMVTTLACIGSVILGILISGGEIIPFTLLTSLFIAVGGGVLWWGSRLRLVQRLGRGRERMLGDFRALVAGLVGRLMVLASNTARMGFAAAILDIDLGLKNVIILSAAALMLGFNPLGRVGWREWTLMMLTPYLAAGAFEGDSIESLQAQLVLIESAGELLAIIPFGIITSIWVIPRLIRGRDPGLDKDVGG